MDKDAKLHLEEGMSALMNAKKNLKDASLSVTGHNVEMIIESQIKKLENCIVVSKDIIENI